MKTRAIYIFMIIFPSLICFSQNTHISGQAYDSYFTDSYIPNTIVTAYIEGSIMGVDTIKDAAGYHISFTLTDIEKETSLPESFEVHQNYPNPFNPHTTIRFDAPESGRLHLSVFDVRGQRLADQERDINVGAGTHEIQLEMNNYSNGVYIYSLTLNDDTKIGKMMFIHNSVPMQTSSSSRLMLKTLVPVQEDEKVTLTFENPLYETDSSIVFVQPEETITGENIYLDQKLRNETKTVEAHITDEDGNLEGANVAVYSLDSLLVEGTTDATGTATLDFDSEYIQDPQSTNRANIPNEVRNEVTADNHVSAIVNKTLTNDQTITFEKQLDIINKTYELDVVLKLYETDGDIVPLSKLARIRFVWNDDTVSVSNENGTANIHAEYYGAKPDTNILVLRSEGNEYLGTMAMTTVNKDKVENIGQSENQSSGLSKSYEDLNQLGEAELYFIPKIVYYGENGDIPAEMDGDLVVGFYEDRYLQASTGHRPTDKYPTTVLLKGTFHDVTGEQVSQDAIDKRNKEIDAYLNATHLPHKNLLNYETKTFTSYQDTTYTNLREPPRNKENISLAVFYNADRNYINYDLEDTPVKYRILYSTTSTTTATGPAGVMSEFFGSMTNTEAALGDFVTNPYTGGNITDLGQNIIGLTYLFKPRSRFWITEGTSYPTQTTPTDSNTSITSKTGFEEIFNDYNSTSTGFTSTNKEK